MELRLLAENQDQHVSNSKSVSYYNRNETSRTLNSRIGYPQIKTTIPNKEQDGYISLLFDLLCKAIALLLFIAHCRPIWGHCPRVEKDNKRTISSNKTTIGNKEQGRS